MKSLKRNFLKCVFKSDLKDYAEFAALMSSDRPFQTLETDCPPAKALSALCSNLNLDTTRTYASDKLRAIRDLINKLQQGKQGVKILAENNC